jgi:hypothetical protein
MKGYADVKWQCHDHFIELFDASVTPVAVEVRRNAEKLFDFVHPERALYIFGPEDRVLSREF